jgi:hypothetical protein
MPVYPVEWVPVTMSGRYPQMAKNDMLVWERFLLIHGGEFEAAAYNVALGGVTPAGDELSEADRLMWKYNTAKKIDALLRREGECWLVEVKPTASLSAIGQVVGYTLLAKVDPFTDLPVFPVIVTDGVDPDVQYVANQLGVSVLIFPERVPPRIG